MRFQWNQSRSRTTESRSNEHGAIQGRVLHDLESSGPLLLISMMVGVIIAILGGPGSMYRKYKNQFHPGGDAWLQTVWKAAQITAYDAEGT
jgi:hypothetical protein